MFRALLDSPVWQNCYEGEGGEGGDGSDGGQGAGVEGDDSGAGGNAGNERLFTQEMVNKFLADDRRKTEAKLEAKWRADKKSALEQKAEEYRQLSQRASLTEQERDEYREKAASAEKAMEEFMTEKERLLKEKNTSEATYKAKLAEKEKAAEQWQNRYVESSIQRALQEAAVTHEAYNVTQMVTTLKPYTKLTDDLEVMVELADVVDGKPATTTLTPDDAMKRMKEMPEMYGNLFRANVVSGVGGNSSTGQGSGKVDPRQMTQAQYREWRKTHLG